MLPTNGTRLQRDRVIKQQHVSERPSVPAIRLMVDAPTICFDRGHVAERTSATASKGIIATPRCKPPTSKQTLSGAVRADLCSPTRPARSVAVRPSGE